VNVLGDPARQAQIQTILGHLLARPVKVEWAVGEAQSQSSPAARAVAARAGSEASEGQATPAPAAPGAIPAAPTQRLSQSEINQVVADPTVRTMMELFGAQLVSVERSG